MWGGTLGLGHSRALYPSPGQHANNVLPYSQNTNYVYLANICKCEIVKWWLTNSENTGNWPNKGQMELNGNKHVIAQGGAPWRLVQDRDRGKLAGRIRQTQGAGSHDGSRNSGGHGGRGDYGSHYGSGYEWALDERALEERTLEERALEEQTLEERALEERALEEQTLEERALEERALDSKTSPNILLIILWAHVWLQAGTIPWLHGWFDQCRTSIHQGADQRSCHVIWRDAWRARPTFKTILQRQDGKMWERITKRHQPATGGHLTGGQIEEKEVQDLPGCQRQKSQKLTCPVLQACVQGAQTLSFVRI